MDAIAFGQAGLQGWRAKVADAVARPVATRSDVAADRVRAVVGAAFFVLSVVYVVSTVRRFLTRT
jgi:hypothetical protein